MPVLLLLPRRLPRRRLRALLPQLFLRRAAMVLVNGTIVTILWMRHGLSCANVLDGCSRDAAKIGAHMADGAVYDAIDGELAASAAAAAAGLRADRARGLAARRDKTDCALPLLDGASPRPEAARLHDAYRDPALTDCAVATSALAGAALRARVGAVDAVLSSALRRARETAEAAFPGVEVYEAPFVVEKPHSSHSLQLDNEPRPLDAVRRRASLVPDGALRNASSWPGFLSFVGASIVPWLEAGAAPRRDAGVPVSVERPTLGAEPSKFTIAVVGHGDMMWHVCGTPRKLSNNAVLSRRVVVDAAGVVSEEAGPCGVVIGAPPQALAAKALVAADVERCRDPFAVAPFLDLADGPSTCVAAARAPDAFAPRSNDEL